jgi:serine beta-lactamase-like protein LACTB
VENRVPATQNTIMRIASISKSLTLAALGRLMDEGKVDLDKPVVDLVSEWPKVE